MKFEVLLYRATVPYKYWYFLGEFVIQLFLINIFGRSSHKIVSKLYTE